ncbi:MAG: hypothetical protein JW795_16595 [Chitinivibrionales bacterium]|nr:hypothetical protein [Chitinivibrionales bacterium]
MLITLFGKNSNKTIHASDSEDELEAIIDQKIIETNQEVLLLLMRSKFTLTNQMKNSIKECFDNIKLNNAINKTVTAASVDDVFDQIK